MQTTAYLRVAPIRPIDVRHTITACTRLLCEGVVHLVVALAEAPAVAERPVVELTRVSLVETRVEQTVAVSRLLETLRADV